MNKKSIFIRGCAWLFVITVFFVLAVSESYARTGADTLPVAGIEAGMEGYGRTVFSGTRIDTFAVKVLGVLENVMPGQDLILIRAESDTLHHTNIMSGMSGSPIYIGGRLIGALAYGWSFGKDPIAGVTPIENILKSRQIEYSEPEGARRIVTPLIASGFSSAGLESLSENLRARGMPVEIMTGGSDKKEKTSAELEAGSAVGVQLVRGDLNLAAIGTVTHVDNEGRVYAFGHPFLNAGQIDFPMTAASVETTFASLQSSFKIASPLQPLGAITEDRQASIVGELGRQPEMIPVNVELSRPHQNFEEEYAVEIINNRYLTPGLLNQVAFSFVDRKLNQLGTERVKTEIKIELKNQPTANYSTITSSESTFDPWGFFQMAQLWGNEFKELEVQSVDISVEAEASDRRARIVDIWAEKNSLQRDDKFKIYIEIDPYRARREILSYQLELPERMRGDVIRVSVLPASQVAERLPRPRSLKQLINFTNSIQNPDKMAVVLEYPDLSINTAGRQLENLPPGFARSLAYGDREATELLPAAGIEIKETGWVLSGSEQIIIPVETR